MHIEISISLAERQRKIQFDLESHKKVIGFWNSLRVSLFMALNSLNRSMEAYAGQSYVAGEICIPQPTRPIWISRAHFLSSSTSSYAFMSADGGSLRHYE